MDTKLCKNCGEEKPLTDFTRSRPKANWSGSNDFRATDNQCYHTYCKVCNAAKGRAFRAAHTATNGAGYRGTNKLKKVPAEDRKLMSLIRHRLVCAKIRIRKFNQIETNLDEDYLYDLMLSQDRRCSLTKLKFVIEKDHPLCPSLDKIEPDKGYVKGNVQWLFWAVNRAKGDLDTHNFLVMCKRIVEVSERATTIP